MKLFVLGGSGGVGRHVLTLARAQGHDVTALVRPASQGALPASPSPGSSPSPASSPVGSLEVIVGEVLGGEALDRMRGHDAVVSCLGIQRKSVRNPWSSLTSAPDFCSRSATRIVEAMARTGVTRIVAVSAAGVGDSAPNMNLVMKLLVGTSKIGVAYRDLAVMENVYRDAGQAQGIDWLCPRPTRLTDGPRTDKVQVLEGFPLNAAISRADVAAWMLASLTVPSFATDWPARTPQITAA